jgi:hypothetical protein
LRPRRDELWLISGSLVSGLAALTFITASSRSLGLDQFGQVIQIWTIWALSAGVLGFSVQQHVIASDGAYRNVLHVLRSRETLRVLVPLMSGIAVVTAVWGPEIFGDSSVIWPVIATLIPPGCAATSAAMGLWAVRRNFRFVAILAALENVLRAAAALLLCIFDSGSGSFALAILLGFGVACFAPSSGLPTNKTNRQTTHTYGAAVAGLIAYAILVMSPMIMAIKSVDVVGTSSTFLVLALLRAPYQFALSLVPKLAANWQSTRHRTGKHDQVDQQDQRSVSPRLVPAFWTVSGIAAVAIGTPVAVRILFGTTVGVSIVQSLFATGATALAVVNIALTLAAVSARLDRQLIAVWLAAAVMGLIYVIMTSALSLTSMLCTVGVVELGVTAGLSILLTRHGVPLFVGEYQDE